LRCGCRRRRRSSGQQRQRIDIALVVGGDADPEVHVRRCRDWIAALADTRDAIALRNVHALADHDLAELQQRHRVAVTRPNRDRMTAVRNAADERDRPSCRCDDGRPDGGADVDTAVLTACVGVAPERERPEHRTI
jgi:hypothetical protein